MTHVQAIAKQSHVIQAEEKVARCQMISLETKKLYLNLEL